MVDQAQIVRVAVASPGDVDAERGAIPALFVRWNTANHGVHLTPEMWETDSVPSYGGHPQHFINERIIDRSDLLIAVFWTRIGSPTPNEKSGTIEEIREFARRKGPKRVMVYFCTRPVSQSPDEIDPVAFTLLKEFKAEVREKCLYQEFGHTAEFEKHLYHHLDIKVEELLRGLLPTPSEETQLDAEEMWWDPNAADKRLREPFALGSSVPEIAASFSTRMDEFDADQGCTCNTFLDLGAHVYRSVARSLERTLRSQPYAIPVQSRPALQAIAARLRELGDAARSYLKRPFPEYWKTGREVSDELNAVVATYDDFNPPKP